MPESERHLGSPLTNNLFSLWLLFPKEVADRLAAHISCISDKIGGPSFEPHVTLAADIALGTAVEFERRALAIDRQQTDRAEFCPIQFGGTYFQSLYLPLILPDALAELRREAFAINGAVPFFPPHVSLAYGADDNARDLPLIREIEREFEGKKVELQSLALVASSDARPIADWRKLRATALDRRART